MESSLRDETKATAITYDGVEEHGLVESGHERVDGVLIVRVIELVSRYLLDLVTEIAVLLRVRYARRHRQQGFLLDENRQPYRTHCRSFERTYVGFSSSFIHLIIVGLVVPRFKCRVVAKKK